MPKVKVHRVPPSLDMTPMVDLAFLLVTFFMLTTKFAPDEPVVVDTPSSVSEIKIPETNLITITIAKDGKVFFNVDGQQTRKELIRMIGEQYKIEFTEDEKNSFALASSIGVPVSALKQVLNMSPDERKKLEQPGIPTDSTNNELSKWLLLARLANPKSRIAIKGDGSAPYPAVRKVFETIQDKANKINRFNLVTDLETGQN